MIRNKLSKFIMVLVAFAAVAGCSVEPIYYKEVVPNTFFDSQDNVWQRFYRPFSHWRWYIASNSPRWNMQELGTDEVCLPTRGSDWYNGGAYEQWHHHVFTPQLNGSYEGWYGFAMGVAVAWDALEDIDRFVDFETMRFPEGTRESMVYQLQTLVASFYLDGLDFFGGVPLYTHTGGEVKARSTDVETFNFIDSLLTEAIPNLPLKTTMGTQENGGISRATGAALKMKLYFNANAYIGKEMWAEAADICRDIIDGKYGLYELASDWMDIFGFTNDVCPEIIWTVPSQNTRLQTDGGYYSTWGHYNQRFYLGNIDGLGGNNGYAIVPSLKPDGTRYDYKLGGVFAKFENTDVRKQPYVYLGGGKYRGMFIMGLQVNPITDGTCLGAREYQGEVINMVDQITYNKRLGTPEYPTVNDLPSTILTAEENSGIRLIKRSPMPNLADRILRENPDIPIIRLTEVYYTLAECEMRMNNKEEAVRLINTVRKRYFEGGNDPNPVTAANLDKYRMLDEWSIEFLGEARRRTDLVRWNAYVTESWWDHVPSNDPNKNKFPVNERIIGSSNMIEQNPGY
jgi:hypothetical protein